MISAQYPWSEDIKTYRELQDHLLEEEEEEEEEPRRQLHDVSMKSTDWKV